MSDLDKAIAAAHESSGRVIIAEQSQDRDAMRAALENCFRTQRDLLAALDAARGEAVAWVPVVGFEGVYEVSSAGLVRRIDSGKILSTAAKAGDGYVKCDLYKSGARTQTYLHRVVCEAFHGPANGRQVNHKDGDKENNAASNLEWVSGSENVNHSYYVLGNNVSPVEAYDHSHGQEALSFESVEQAVRSGFNSAHIYRCINNANKRHGGYRWRFTNAAPPALQAGLDHARRRIGELTIQLGEAMKFPPAAVPEGYVQLAAAEALALEAMRVGNLGGHERTIEGHWSAEVGDRFEEFMFEEGFALLAAAERKGGES